MDIMSDPPSFILLGSQELGREVPELFLNSLLFGQIHCNDANGRDPLDFQRIEGKLHWYKIFISCYKRKFSSFFPFSALLNNRFKDRSVFRRDQRVYRGTYYLLKGHLKDLYKTAVTIHNRALLCYG